MIPFSIGSGVALAWTNVTRRGNSIALLLAAAAAVEFLREAWQIQPQIDDAYIYYRYARNLVEGQGLVYNAGEYVEGNTSFLWTLLVAGGLALGFEAETAAHGLGVLGGVATLLLTCVYALKGLAPERKWLAGLAPWIVLSFPGLVRWSESGLETSVFAACVICALAAAARERNAWAVGSTILASLARPDGVLLAGVVFGLPLLATRFRDWRAWKAPLVYAAAMLLLTLFRLYYYGYPVPNTFYAKIGGTPLSYGLSALWTFSGDGVWLLAIAAVPAALTSRRFLPGAVYGVLVVVYVVWIGGDVLGADRLFLPAVPAVAAMAVASTAWGYERSKRLGVLLAGLVATGTGWQLWGSIPLEIAAAGGALLVGWLLSIELGRRWLLPVTAAGVSLVAGIYLLGSWGDDAARQTFIADNLRSSARGRTIDQVRRSRARLEKVARHQLYALQRQNPTLGLIALTGIGRFGYRSSLPILDLVGLVDETIAHTELSPREGALPVSGHQRSNADYVFSRKPDYILINKLGPTTGIRIRAHLDIWDHPALERDYVWDARVLGYRRVDLLPRVAPEPASR